LRELVANEQPASDRTHAHWINIRMKILLSVFACSPNAGSENGGGWRWAVELARAGHTVIALTDITRKAAIDRELKSRPVAGLKVVYFRPNWLNKFPLNSRTAQILFSAWQYSLVPAARMLHKEHDFDLAIHLTYGTFRTPSFLGRLGIPFIFGPVGGGEDAPWELKRGLPMRELVKEALRTVLIKVSKFNPFLRVALRSATLVLTRTDDTRRALPGFAVKDTVVYQEIGIDRPERQHVKQGAKRAPQAPLNLLFAGRLLGWKGIHLALKAVALARTQKCDCHLTIVGSGPLEIWLKQLAEELGVGANVTWLSHMPQTDLFEMYGRMHGFLFPSLHDSGGNVVLEALSFGLPVVCLNIGGPVTLVSEECALVVPVQNAVQSEVVARLAKALCQLYFDEVGRQEMSHSARDRAAAMSWVSRPLGALKLLAAAYPENASLQNVEPRKGLAT
jgi:glycosyltransferase involved in cell wall biosynthesis